MKDETQPSTEVTKPVDRSRRAANGVSDEYVKRHAQYWPRLETVLRDIYSDRPDISSHLSALDAVCAQYYADRSDILRTLDHAREESPLWFLSENMVGMTLYVDLFAGTFDGVKKRIPYLVDLGITYLHLMPLFKVPPGENDGGYAVSDYRETRAELGGIDALKDLIAELRTHGIAVAVDFIFNHTADDHNWALQAKAGDVRYLKFFYSFDDRDIPSSFERTLREIFPETRRGSFTWDAELNRWVWTTFNSYQWDLNYSNPDVFVAMATEMLFLANLGVDVLRLDAVAFVWKRLGTTCENLDEAHSIIRALNLVCRIAAPAVLFKSEAIVHPDDVVRYIAADECQLSYNPTLMALLWEAAATRETQLLRTSLSHRQSIDPRTNWINYLRCHDDIGWSFDDGDAWSVGIDPDGHRRFLNRFYTGDFPGTFARGVPFQYNPVNHDLRVCGTFASLIGFEDAGDDELLRKMALARARMLFGVLFSIGGIPLIYAGEECGDLNDYRYVDNPYHQDDARWVHRIRMNWSDQNQSDSGWVGQRLRPILNQIIAARKAHPALAGTQMSLQPTPSPHLLAYWRRAAGEALFVIANFSERPVPILGGLHGVLGSVEPMLDRLTGQILTEGHLLEPYALHWCVPCTELGS